uniref:Ig-like domain-containing protein n=1 Tax=Cyprinus carpio TaxID=7962 RepID=A0A8C1MZ24_CYPCA
DSVCSLSVLAGLTRAETPVTVRRVTHPPLRRPLSGSALLPCVFTLPAALLPGAGPFIRWSRGAGAQERTVLFARDGVVRVHRAYVGRVSLPGYSADPLNASLALSQLRSNDSGSFRCHILYLSRIFFCPTKPYDWFSAPEAHMEIKKRSGWIFIIVGWLCSHTANTHLCPNNT